MSQNNGEGSLLPETLRLAGYGLGHDERAKEHQPVAGRLGPRFYDCQLAQTPEEVWCECHLHARNMLGEGGYLNLLGEVLRDRTEGGWREVLTFAFELSKKENLLRAFEVALGLLPSASGSRRLDEARAIIAERGFTLDRDDLIQVVFFLGLGIFYLLLRAEITTICGDNCAKEQVMRSVDFFGTHPVFRHEEFLAAHTSGGRSPLTSNNLLARHLASGRLLRVRRGLYAVVPRGVDPGQATVDPYLVASQLTGDAVVAYHAALQFQGKSYSVWRRFHYLTRKRARAFLFRDLEFAPVQMSKTIRASKEPERGVSEVAHAGGRVRVTTMERTMVDVLDKPDKCGSWEEIWRSLEMVEFFDLDAVIAHARSIGSSLTLARVGFFLDQHRETLMVEDKHLDRLQAHAPKQPRYLDGARKSGKLVTRWNLVVPEYVLERRWEEAG